MVAREERSKDLVVEIDERPLALVEERRLSISLLADLELRDRQPGGVLTGGGQLIEAERLFSGRPAGLEGSEEGGGPANGWAQRGADVLVRTAHISVLTSTASYSQARTVAARCVVSVLVRRRVFARVGGGDVQALALWSTLSTSLSLPLSSTVGAAWG
jgi:hypothetical protein